jgi:transposase InsO family protein
VERITKLYEERYKGFSVKHFHEFACRDHGLRYGYTWTKNHLESSGLVKRSKRGGDHRLRRERRPMAGMMIHQDGSTHLWIPSLGHSVDLIVTMDDATSIITSAFFVLQEGTQSSLQGIKETIERYGLFCSLYTDRGSHYWFTPEAGAKVSKHQLTQVGRALKQLGIQHIAAYSPQARGRSERMFGTLQKRLPQELALQNITTLAEANRYLNEVYIPRHNQQFAVPAKEEKAAYAQWIGIELDEILCLQEERTVRHDNTVQYNNLILQIHQNDFRHHYVKTIVQVREYLDGTLALFYGHRCLGRYNALGTLLANPVETMENSMSFPPFPQSQQPQPKEVLYAFTR